MKTHLKSVEGKNHAEREAIGFLFKNQKNVCSKFHATGIKMTNGVRTLNLIKTGLCLPKAALQSHLAGLLVGCLVVLGVFGWVGWVCGLFSISCCDSSLKQPGLSPGKGACIFTWLQPEQPA